jgi:hypothetical protein
VIGYANFPFLPFFRVAHFVAPTGLFKGLIQATEIQYIQKNTKNKKAQKSLSLKSFRAFKAVGTTIRRHILAIS